MNHNPIEELRRRETPVTEEEWTSIVKDPRYVQKFGHKAGLSPKGRAALIAGAAIALITVPLLIKTLSNNTSETAQAVTQTPVESVVPEATTTNETVMDTPAPGTTAPAASTPTASHDNVTVTANPPVHDATQTNAPSAVLSQPTATPTASEVKPTTETPNPTPKASSSTTPQKAENKPVDNPVPSVTTAHENVNNDIVMRSAEEEPVIEADQFFIPSAFTPNGDGLNDLFFVKANFQPRSFEMTILNRGGDALFQTRDMNIGWDGQLHGKLLPHGVYVCIIKYKDSQGNEHKQQGQVLLIP